MASTQFGLALDAPITQTLLPVVSNPSSRVYGFFMISSTTFQGTETSFLVQTGMPTVPLQSITHPLHNVVKTVGVPTWYPDVRTPAVTQYMAVVYPDDSLIYADRGMGGTSGINTNAPWRGYSSFIDPVAAGYSDRFINAINGYQHNINLGVLVGSLTYGMTYTAVSPIQPTPPTGSSATMNWFADISQAALYSECPYFDFNWITIFNASLQKAQSAGTQAYGQLVPQSLQINTVPTGFKAFLVNQPTIVPGTNLLYDTLRIVAVGGNTITAGAYVFDFSVVSDQGSVAVTLTLNVTVS